MLSHSEFKRRGGNARRAQAVLASMVMSSGGGKDAAASFGRFDGTDDYVAGPTLTIPGSFSVALKFRHVSLGTGLEYLIAANGSSQFAIVNRTTNMIVYCGGVVNRITTTTGNIGLGGDWVDLAFTWDGTTALLYIDGSAVATNVVGTLAPSWANALVTGCQGVGVNSFFHGDQRDLKIYNDVLTAAEVAHLAGLSGDDPGMANLVLHWDYADGSGSQVTDSSGNGNNGTLGAGVVEADFWNP